MKKLILFFFAAILLHPAVSNAQNKVDAETRIKELGIQLIKPTSPIANYVKAVRVGNIVYLSGHGPDKPDGGLVTGKAGGDLTWEQARDAARLTGISLLSSLKAEIGNKLGKTVTPINIITLVKCSKPRIFPARPVAMPTMPAFFPLKMAIFERIEQASINSFRIPGNEPLYSGITKNSLSAGIMYASSMAINSVVSVSFLYISAP